MLKWKNCEKKENLFDNSYCHYYRLRTSRDRGTIFCVYRRLFYLNDFRTFTRHCNNMAANHFIHINSND